jgi:release factor glutamine methyltransferase
MRAGKVPAPTWKPSSVADLLREVEATLLGAGVVVDRAEARAEALVLAGHALNMGRSELLVATGDAIAAECAQALRGLVRRRAAGEPTAYIVGRRWFYGLEFAVDARVLVPRPETELLVELTLDRIKGVPDPLMCDVGCGSGCVGIAVAVNDPRVRVYATDISEGCLALARGNALRHSVLDRVQLLQGDLVGPLTEPVHVIAANLPYINTGELDGLDITVRDHEPRLALDGGPDGLVLISRLLADCPRCLLPGGRVLIEVGWDQARAVADQASRKLPRWNVSLHKDLAGIDRVVEILAH